MYKQNRVDDDKENCYYRIWFPYEMKVQSASLASYVSTSISRIVNCL